MYQIERMDEYQAALGAAAQYLKERWPTPDLAVVLGSGLAGTSSFLEDAVEVSYSAIPGFPPVGAPGHEGRLLIGRLGGKSLAMLLGRVHYYEGASPLDVVFPIRVLALWGVRALILTNAAGAINRALKPPCLMLLKDHISLFAPSPLRGANLDEWGPRFPDQSYVYDPEFLCIARHCASRQNLSLYEGIYCYAQGPAYETPADIALIGHLGGDAVGMSTVPEAQAAVHAGMRVLGLSCLTNWAAGIGKGQLSEKEVLDGGRALSDQLARLITDISAAL